MEKISVVINTYNASRFLRKALDTVKDFDEIVICDMESTDDTLDIAREYGCTIVTFPKGDCVSAEPARTFAIQSARYEWVLVIDADELVTPELRQYLYDHIARTDQEEGVWIPRRNYFMGRFMHATYPDYLLRFFIKEGTVWPAEVHTFPTVNGRTLHIPRNRQDLAFTHIADDSVSDRLRKMDQYTDNEVVKRSHKHYGVGALLYRPFYRFFKFYVLKSGWRDGIPGLINAMLEAGYQVAMVSKMIERRTRK